MHDARRRVRGARQDLGSARRARHNVRRHAPAEALQRVVGGGARVHVASVAGALLVVRKCHAQVLVGKCPRAAARRVGRLGHGRTKG